MAKTKPRDILTPIEDIVLSTDGGKVFWKRVLPETQVDYVDDEGNKRKLDFAAMIPKVLSSFEQRILDRTPFVLADANNRHTMDPERERGTVTKACRWEDLPTKVQSEIIAKEGAAAPGLYTKIKFPTPQAAQAVINSDGKLGVSARLRENYEAPDGRKADVALIHVLGTSDPKLGNLGDWSEDHDLSSYAPSELIDLSDQTYPEAPMGKSKGDTIDLATLTDEDVLAGKVTGDHLDEMTDEQLAEFVDKFGHLSDDTDPDGDGDDDDDDDDEPQETKLSSEAQRQIDLARQQSQRAIDLANETTRKATEREWKTRRRELIRKGIPPEKIDLAEPFLARPDALVIDLSNTSFGGDKAAQVGKVIEELLEGYAGVIPMDLEFGHGGNGDVDTGDGGDIDAELNAAWERDFGHLDHSRAND